MWQFLGRGQVLILGGIFLYMSVAQAQSDRPRIGLVLSGGGAKGVAHIGLLKALDSAGIRVDYVTGTSMGAIVGGLYAAGYSGEEIEKMVLKLDWTELLSNQVSLRQLIMEEKEEFGKYALEIPRMNGKFKISSGLLEAQALWSKLTELFFPVLDIHEFDSLPIPFRCIATDLSTGKIEVMKDGDIVSAIRASMAIPSVFTAVSRNGKMLVDGGIRHNFPVREVKEMGADYVIGVSVSTAVRPEDLDNAVTVLTESMFLADREDYEEEKKKCDLFIQMPVQDYSSASFNKVMEILRVGIAEGRQQHDRLKAIADSLGLATRAVTERTRRDSFYIRDIRYEGLRETDTSIVRKTFSLPVPRYYKAEQLDRKLSNLFGTRFFRKLTYSMHQLDSGGNRLQINAVENPRTYVKVGLHYNTFAGISLIGNLTVRNWLGKQSRSYITANLGENMRFRLHHQQIFGRSRSFAWILTGGYETFQFTTYNERFREDGEYGNDYTYVDTRLQRSAGRSRTLALGFKYETSSYKPVQTSFIDLEGGNRFFTGYVLARINSLDRPVYPFRGWKLDWETGYVFGQNHYLEGFRLGVPVRLDSLPVSFDNYLRSFLRTEWYLQASRNWTVQMDVQAGFNFSYRQVLINDFIVGGMTKQFRNQVTLVGFPEHSAITGSVLALGLAPRWQVLQNVNLQLRGNVARLDLLDSRTYNRTWLHGYAATVGVVSPIGPLELSLQYNGNIGKFISYVNLGVTF